MCRGLEGWCEPINLFLHVPTFFLNIIPWDFRNVGFWSDDVGFALGHRVSTNGIVLLHDGKTAWNLQPCLCYESHNETWEWQYCPWVPLGDAFGQSMIYKLFHIFLKSLSLLACERNLQDFNLSKKIGVIPQIHFASHGFSPIKLKTHAIWVRKDYPRWVLLTCPWFNSFNYLWRCLLLVFGCFIFLGWFDYSKNPKTLKNFKKTKIFYFVSSFIFLEDCMNYDISLDLEHAWHCGETWIVS